MGADDAMISTRGEKMREDRNLRRQGENYGYPYFADGVDGDARR
jgi:glucose/arabinose dehydrogenase